MQGFLAEAVSRSRQRVEQWRREGLLDHLRETRPAPGSPRSLSDALRAQAPGALIAEIKRASPSQGWIAKIADPARIARSYERGGAAAVSVLTESFWFAGALDDLSMARSVVRLPVLRKDFMVDDYEFQIARAVGADAVLLIAACLPGEQLREALAMVRSLDMEALVETHTPSQLAAARETGAEIIGVNARNLETLEVNANLALKLVAEAPADRVRVLESGVRCRADVEAAIAAGADAVLVGEALMRADNPEAFARALVEAPP